MVPSVTLCNLAFASCSKEANRSQSLVSMKEDESMDELDSEEESREDDESGFSSNEEEERELEMEVNEEEES